MASPNVPIDIILSIFVIKMKLPMYNRVIFSLINRIVVFHSIFLNSNFKVFFCEWSQIEKFCMWHLEDMFEFCRSINFQEFGNFPCPQKFVNKSTALYKGEDIQYLFCTKVAGIRTISARSRQLSSVVILQFF